MLAISRQMLGVCAIGLAVLPSIPAAAFQLITQSEAELPGAGSIRHERGISRGPTISFVSPSPGTGTIKSPINIVIRFESHGGAAINANSVLLTYMKEPPIDLTQRIKPFITPGGIDIEDAEVPPGTHWLRVEVTDSHGYPSQADLAFTVSQ